jgi:RHS repeat-associated protein
MISDGINYYVYGPDGLPLEQIPLAASGYAPTLWLHHDNLGSTILLTDYAGTTQASYSYDAYGNPTYTPATSGGVTSMAATPFEYTAGWTDPGSGLLWLNARWYDPTTGQFMSIDPKVAQTNSAYGYAAGNPIMFIDPSGMSAWSDLGNWIGDASQWVSDAGHDAAAAADFVGTAIETHGRLVGEILIATAAIVGGLVCLASIACGIAVGALASGAFYAGQTYGTKQFSVGVLAEQMALGGALGAAGVGGTRWLDAGSGQLDEVLGNGLFRSLWTSPSSVFGGMAKFGAGAIIVPAVAEGQLICFAAGCGT